MKPVSDQSGFCKGLADYLFHAGSHVKGYLFDGQPFFKWYFPLQDRFYPLAVCSFHHGYQAPFVSFRGLIGNYGVKLSLGKSSLVNGKVLTHIIRKNNMVFCMVKLVPIGIITQMCGILLFQEFAVHMKILSQAFTTYRGCIDVSLLKKPRIPWSSAFLLLPVPSPGKLFCSCLHSTTACAAPSGNRLCQG